MRMSVSTQRLFRLPSDWLKKETLAGLFFGLGLCDFGEGSIPVVAVDPRLSISTNTAERICFGNGQFMLFARPAYAAVEGHKAVYNHVLDDVRMAEALNRAGFATEIRPAFWAFQVRLYRSLGEIINGYTKNLFEGMGRKPLAGLAAAAFTLLVQCCPLWSSSVVGGPAILQLGCALQRAAGCFYCCASFSWLSVHG